MIDGQSTGKEPLVQISKVRPKAPVFVKDTKRVQVEPVLPEDAVPFRDYVEDIDGATVTFWRCPVVYSYSVHFTTIEYDTAKCSCVTWT